MTRLWLDDCCDRHQSCHLHPGTVLIARGEAAIGDFPGVFFISWLKGIIFLTRIKCKSMHKVEILV